MQGPCLNLSLRDPNIEELSRASEVADTGRLFEGHRGTSPLGKSMVVPTPSPSWKSSCCGFQPPWRTNGAELRTPQDPPSRTQQGMGPSRTRTSPRQGTGPRTCTGRSCTCVGRHCTLRLLQQPEQRCTSTQGGHTRKLALVRSMRFLEIWNTSVRVLHSAIMAGSATVREPAGGAGQHLMARELCEFLPPSYGQCPSSPAGAPVTDTQGNRGSKSPPMSQMELRDLPDSSL